ncbi:acyltransferase [Spirosoma sp. KCTC 42546]|uniref:acyltransferase n=1 Tax=Spirosoma sp. KCTC 42546 TaxID=2520506 RepID=UPI001156C7D1|nr:acyltransferase [Spirosoma sp. KCTC 42546]QDK80122.1 acyltransferase [Spirosoma sp. KCTC 42546]
MKQRVYEFIKQHPMLLKLALVIKSGSFFKSTVTKTIQGKRNKLSISRSAFCVNCTIDIDGNDNTILIEEGARLHGLTVYIRGNSNRIHIAKQVRFKRGGSLWIEDERGEISIGTRTMIEDVHVAVTEPGSSIRIGEDCLLAYDIDVRTGDSHSILDATTGQRINYAKDVVIDDHVWIAAHCSILKGVRIRKNSIVATRSVLTKSFDQEGIIIGGNPAKLLKDNINWAQERLYDG